MIPTFSNSPIRTSLTIKDCNGGVVKAFFESCAEPVSFVNYSRVGNDFVITKFGYHQRLSEKEARLVGDAIDLTLEKEAIKLGIKRLLVVLLNNDTAQHVRFYNFEPSANRISYNTQSAVFIN